MSVETFLRQRAVNIAVEGSFALQRRWYDSEGRLRIFPCRTTRLSPFRMLVEAQVIGPIGEHITSYFREFGELEGVISHAATSSFLVEMQLTPARRARLADQLTWLEKKLGDPSVEDTRQDPRIIPPTAPSVFILADGSVHGCAIIDISSSGAAISAETRPPIGTPLAIGACVGRVVRIFDNGFAVRFVERQRLDALSRLVVVQPRPGSSSSADDWAGPLVGEPSASAPEPDGINARAGP